MNDDKDFEPSDFEPSELESSDLESSELDSTELDSTEPDLIARLRAADPAAGVEPRAGFADAVIARTVAEPVAGSAAPEPVSDLTAERAKRRPRWLPYIAVAASLALVGGAGFGIGAAAAGGTGSSTEAAPPISLQGGVGTGGGAPGAGQNGATQPGAMQNGAVQPGVGAVAGAQSKMSAGGSSDMIYPGFGRNTFASSGLSTKAGTGSAYTFDARSASNADTVSALAAALGVAGTAELKDGSWQVGAQDGTSPSLTANLDGTLSFYFTDPRINPWQCDDTSAPCEPPTTLPSEDAAIAALRSLITSAGRDAGSFEFTSETWDGAFTRSAQAWPVVDGKRIDQSWSVDITDAGIYSASGALSDIVPLGEYPVVSEQDAFTRLSDPRFGAQMTGMPIALRSNATGEAMSTDPTAPSEWVAPTEPPATPTTGTSLSWPVNKVDIVSARLGLASQWQPDGSILIVPAYEFTDAGGGTWSVIAVADAKLDFATK